MEEEFIDIEPAYEPTPEPEPFVIPDIYIYSELTNEYMGKKEAERDPEESKVQGHFMPLVPQFATLVEVPEYGENEIPVFGQRIEEKEIEVEVIDYDEEGNPIGSHTETKIITEIIDFWEVKSDYRKNFYKVDNNLNVSEIKTIGEQEGYFIVDKETGDDIKANKDWYKIVDNEIVKKSQEEYEEEQAQKREAEFNAEFFQTSLGYIRRAVNMANGTHKDFLSDLLPAISASVQMGQAVNIIAYDKPPFDEDIEDWTQYQHIEVVTPQFVQECFMQLSNDFLPINEEK